MSDLDQLERQFKTDPTDEHLVLFLVACERERREPGLDATEHAQKRSGEWIRQILARKGVRYYVNIFQSNAQGRWKREYRTLVRNGRGRWVKLKASDFEASLPSSLAMKLVRKWARCYAYKRRFPDAPTIEDWEPTMAEVLTIWRALNERTRPKPAIKGETFSLFGE